MDQTETLPPVTLDESSAESEQETAPIVRKPIDRYSRLMMSPNRKSSFIARAPPNSLNRLMANRGSIKAVHASFVRNMESSLRQNKKKGVCFGEIDYGYGDAAPDGGVASATSNTTTADYGHGDAAPADTDYGYGDAAPDGEPKKEEPQEEEPASKRRRYQRRNSKTPAMLMAMNAPLLLQLDFLEDSKEASEKKQGVPTASSPLLSPLSGSGLSKDSWDGGLEIAEELVKHLQKRRQSQT